MISAKDIDVKVVPKGIDNTTHNLVQRLALDQLVILNARIEIKYRPYKIIKIVGSSSIFRKRDTDIQILLTNNQGRVEVITGLKFQGQNNGINALEQVFIMKENKATNGTVTNSTSTQKAYQNTTSSQNYAFANFKTNFLINQIAFIISRNDISIKDVLSLTKFKSNILADKMVLNEGLNLRVIIQQPEQCTDSAVFCFFLKKISKPVQLQLYSKVYDGVAQLTGKFKNSLRLDNDNVVVTDPSLVIQIKYQEDANLKIRGKIQNFQVFVEKQEIKKKNKDVNNQQLTKPKDRNLKPLFDVEIVNHLNVQLLVTAQSSEVVVAQTSPKQMVEFTQLRLSSVIPKNSDKFTQVKLSGLGVFGQKCLNLPKTQSNTPKLSILEKSSKQQLKKNITNYQSTIKSTQTIGDNCYASWLQFGDQVIDLTGNIKPGFYGIIKASTFRDFIRPFIVLQDKDQDYVTFFRNNFIPAISEDLTLKLKWSHLQFDPYMIKKENATLSGYRYHAPAEFMGCEGMLSGSIVPQNQSIKVKVDLRPTLIAKDNIQILNINYDYIKNKGAQQNEISKQRATAYIQYYPGIPHQEQVFIETEVTMFEVQNVTRIQVSRSMVSFDLDQAKVFNSTLPFLIRVTGSYKPSLTQIQFKSHGQLGSNQARVALQNDVLNRLAKKRDEASQIVWMINSQKVKTLSILSLLNKTRTCTSQSCPMITECEEGDQYQPLLNCKEFQKKQKCVSERQICPHFKEQCVKTKKQCVKYDTSSGKCLKDYEVCEKWENTCTSKLSKICTDYEIEEVKDTCLQYSFDCKTIKKRSEECIHRCEEGQKLANYFDERLQFYITLQNRALSLFQWREYLQFLSEKDQGFEFPMAQIVDVSFDSDLDSYKNPIDIEVSIMVQLAFEDDKQFVVIKTTAETLKIRDLLVDQISNAIIKHIAIKLDIDDIQLWKNMSFVKDMMQNMVEDKKMLSLHQKVTQTQSDKNEHDWIINELKNMKYNELGQAEGEVISEKLRVKKDGGEFLPNDIQVLIEKLAGSKEKIIQFQPKSEEEKLANVILYSYSRFKSILQEKNEKEKKEKADDIKSPSQPKDQKNKKDNKMEKTKQPENLNQKKNTQEIVSDREITTNKKELHKGQKKETTIKNGMAPENY